MTSPPISEKEFSNIIRKHSSMINKISYFYASEQLPFEDLRQEIYVNLWQALPHYKDHSKLSTWIYRVAVNSALMTLRSSKTRYKTVSVDFNICDLSSELDDIQKENLQTLYSLINRLDPIDKAVILLWLDEYSYEDIAEAVGLKRNTVATKIHRIKKELSKSL